MAKRSGLVGESLLGLGQPENRPPNTFSFGRYLLILFILTLGAIYALPNLYQPDPALQIRGTSDAHPVTPQVLDQALAALAAADIAVKGSALDDGGAIVRMTRDADQQPGRALVDTALNSQRQGRFVVALTRASNTPAWLADIGGKPMSLGLDLSGGVHFLLQVDMDKFLGDRLAGDEETIRNLLVRERLRYTSRQFLDGQQMNITFVDDTTRDAAEEIIGGEFDAYQILSREIDGQPGLRLLLKEEKVRELEELAISQNLQSLRNRVNELGVSEPQVQRQGRTRIVLDLPGIQDSAEAKRIINKFANLEFRLVAGPSARPAQTETYPYEGRDVVLERANIVTGNQVTNAVQEFDPESGQPQVSITLDGQGGQDMNRITRDNVGNQMAILFKELKVRSRQVERDGEKVIENYTIEEKRLINVATIQDALGFRFRITGLGLGEARDLALLLRAGALAAPMYIVEERTIGASLGEANIEQGREAVLIGLALVLVFMVVYYKLFGLAANLALVFNMMLLVAIMSMLGATLTMPGIAGIVLTVGMAVDANVLIFSRIREELKERSPQQAIQSGFDRALLTILDANITTFFVAIILFSVGSGPVRGFAITLAVGIVTSVFTAILCTRGIVNLMFGGRKLKRVWI